MERRNIRILSRRKKKRRIKKIILFISALIIMIVSSYLILTNYIFVKDIVFAGNYHIKDEELLSLLRIKKGDRLFGISKKELYNRIKKSPWVNDASIRKDLSGRISVKIVEAVPLAILSLSDNKYLIDKNGKILEQIKDSPEHFLNILRIDPEHKEAYEEAVRLANILHRRGLFSEGSVEISGNRPEDIALKIDNILIKIGTGDYERKLERLKIVKKEVENRNIQVEYIDLRFADKIVVKPLEEKKESPVAKAEQKKENKKIKTIKKNEKKRKKR